MYNNLYFKESLSTNIYKSFNCLWDDKYYGEVVGTNKINTRSLTFLIYLKKSWRILFVYYKIIFVIFVK